MLSSDSVRLRISLAALFVNVTASTPCGDTPRPRSAKPSTSTRVLPAGSGNDQQISDRRRNGFALTIIQTVENMSDVHTQYGSIEEGFIPHARAIRPSPTSRDCAVIDVRTFQYRCMVGKQLQRHGVDDRRQHFMHRRDRDHRDAWRIDEAGMFVRENVQLAAARAYDLQIRLQLAEQSLLVRLRRPACPRH